MCKCGCEALNGLPELCCFETHKQFGNNPAEYCDEPTTPGSDYCPKHQGEPL